MHAIGKLRVALCEHNYPMLCIGTRMSGQSINEKYIYSTQQILFKEERQTVIMCKAFK